MILAYLVQISLCKMIVEPKEEEAIEKLWQADQAFDENDWETSIYGDSLGF